MKLPNSQPFSPRPDGLAIFLLVARVLVGAVLLSAGFLKAIAPPAEFAAAIEAYKLLPAAGLLPFATVLPWIEMWVGVFLIAGFEIRPAATAAGALFALFLGALLTAKARGINLESCGCFGTEALSPNQTTFMDATLLLLSIALAYFPPARHRFTLNV
jgi:uncharacterized membrane protein YphA (DoxX/SURF4 family)